MSTSRLLPAADRACADRLLAGEAEALGVPRGAFRAAAGRIVLPADVAAWTRTVAPNWAVALSSAGCSERLAKALRDAHRRAVRC